MFSTLSSLIHLALPFTPLPHQNHTVLTTTGRLTWFGTNFSNNATNIGIQRERYLPELVATLRRDDGTEVANQHLLLGERIENMDGNFMVREREPPRQRREGLMEEDPFWRQNMSLGV